MARIPWNIPRSSCRRAIDDCTFQPPVVGLDSLHGPEQTAVSFDSMPMPQPLSDITEVTSQCTEDNYSIEHVPCSSVSNQNIGYDCQPQHRNPTKETPRVESYLAHTGGDRQQLVNNEEKRSREIDDCKRSSPGSLQVIKIVSPDDSSVPLATSSGRVGTLLIRIHRSHPRAFVYGNTMVIGALSHQTWVSGEVLYFDVEIDNTSEKFVKRINLHFVRVISAQLKWGHPSECIQPAFENTNKTLASWIWKKGSDGWTGVAPQTQIAKVWNPIVPSGQATTNEQGVEASYYLAITVPCLIGKTASTSIPLKIIHPNSLGKERLEQGLLHSFRTRNPYGNESELLSEASSEEEQLYRQENLLEQSPKAVPSMAESICSGKDLFRPSMEGKGTLKKHDRDDSCRKNSKSDGIFLNTTSIPRASDELLNEVLLRLQETPQKAKIWRGQRKSLLKCRRQRRMLDQASMATAAATSESAARNSRLPILKPLSNIGAHCRRKSSDDARESSKGRLLAPTQKSLARASFDDYLRVNHKPTRSRDNDAGRTTSFSERNYLFPPPPPPSPDRGNSQCNSSEDSSDEEGTVGRDTIASGDSDLMLSARDRSSNVKFDYERFLRDRRSFQTARRENANPFFKGSAGKERLRTAQCASYLNIESLRDKEQLSHQRRPNRHSRCEAGSTYEYNMGPKKRIEDGVLPADRLSKNSNRKSSRYSNAADRRYSKHRTLF